VEKVAGIQALLTRRDAPRLPSRLPSGEGHVRAERYLTALRRRTSAMRILFALVVLLPTAVAALYYGVIVSKRYVSEAQYIVRGVTNHQATGFNALLSAFGISRVVDDTFAIENFMQSRDAVRLLEQRIPLRAMFSRANADFLARFPHFWRGESFEMLYEYYQQHVSVIQDPRTSVSILRIVSFSPEDSRVIAVALLQLGEEMVNRMNERAERDTVENARAEVARAEAKVVAAQADLTTFRNHELLIDPSQNSVAMLGTITKLSGDLVETSIQLGQTVSGSPSNPGIPSMQARATALRQGIASEREKMAGNESALAAKVSRYERLSMLRDLADKSLASAIGALDVARQEARRQKIYIETIVKPNLADEATEPQRTRSVLTVFVMSFAIFAMGWILLAGAKEHAQ
jgi:capsular polysaccharide transport system permease protein